MDNKKTYNLIGLCQKAGRLTSGEVSSEKAIKSKKSHLLIITKDASKNTHKKFTNRCTYYNVPLIEFGTKNTLGNAIGKKERAVISINDKNLANAITDLIIINKE